jgi:hypothetical protein
LPACRDLVAFARVALGVGDRREPGKLRKIHLFRFLSNPSLLDYSARRGYEVGRRTRPEESMLAVDPPNGSQGIR